MILNTYKEIVLAKEHQIIISKDKLCSDLNDVCFRPEIIEYTIAALFTLSQDVEKVIHLIHDLWSSNVFKKRSVYGEINDSINIKTPLLKPYNEFDDAQRNLEKALGVGDIKGILKGICKHYKDYECPKDYGNLSSALLNVEAAKLLFYFTENQRFLVSIAPEIHDSWRNLKRQAFPSDPDSRLLRSFQELSLSEREITLCNIRVDMLAIAATILEYPSELMLNIADESFMPAQGLQFL